MKWIKLYEAWWDILNKEGYPTYEEVVDYFIDRVDNGKIEVEEFQSQEVLDQEFNQTHRVLRKVIYFKNEKVDKRTSDTWTAGGVSALVYLKVSLPHPRSRIKGNLDLRGYTIDALQDYLKKFVKRSGYKVNIIIAIQDTNTYQEPLSRSIVRIEFLDS